ncbi:MAG TPA: 4-alpha-glucanotransferase, partial [Thermoanaerobaculia bacterium]|nr:4-alpha-glucanotransferase [Thermoanaerobaculia bacterium]
QPDSPHLPHHYEPQTVVYTGTHDNDTARGWYDQATDEERTTAALYLGVHTSEELPWTLIRTAYTSVADTAIVPAQDILGLGNEARMNLPGEEKDNWSWRLEEGALTEELADRLRKLAEVSGRTE